MKLSALWEEIIAYNWEYVHAKIQQQKYCIHLETCKLQNPESLEDVLQPNLQQK